MSNRPKTRKPTSLAAPGTDQTGDPPLQPGENYVGSIELRLLAQPDGQLAHQVLMTENLQHNHAVIFSLAQALQTQAFQALAASAASEIQLKTEEIAGLNAQLDEYQGGKKIIIATTMPKEQLIH